MAVVVLVLGYLLGSLPTGLLVVRALTGQDIRAIGSGNIGTVNVYRVAGLPAAVLVLVVDMLKGAAPVLLARMWGQPAEIQPYCSTTRFAQIAAVQDSRSHYHM